MHNFHLHASKEKINSLEQLSNINPLSPGKDKIQSETKVHKISSVFEMCSMFYWKLIKISIPREKSYCYKILMYSASTAQGFLI